MELKMVKDFLLLVLLLERVVMRFVSFHTGKVEVPGDDFAEMVQDVVEDVDL